jgi:lipid II:glycine glycyltransferase (peptidoglycan interpeptide bridge formation enzyme)
VQTGSLSETDSDYQSRFLSCYNDHMTINLDEIIEEIQQGIADAKADYPDVSEDDITREVVNSILESMPEDIANELRTRLL